MGDVIEIRGLRALGTIGVNREEKERAQPFEVDLDVVTDLAPAGRSDALADTIDYGELVGRVEAVVQSERHELLERVGQRIVEAVLAVDPRIESVRVTLRKLRPPLPVDVATAGITITRHRS